MRRSLMSNVCHAHPVCQVSSSLLFDQLKRPLQFTDAEFRLLNCHCVQLIRLMPVKACQFARLSFQVSLYIRAIIALFQNDLPY